MLEYLKKLIYKHKDILLYVFFGILTTAVNYAVYLPLFNVCSISAAVSNVLAWIAAVIFAYVTNKSFVFQSKDWSRKVVGPELMRFLGCRIGSGFVETIIIFLTVDILQFNGNLMKIFTGVFVIIFNYAASKLFVFNNKKKEGS